MSIVRRFRPRFGAVAGLVVFLAVVMSCTPTDDRSGAVSLVSDLFQAFESQQPERIVAVAPQLEAAPDAVERILQTFRDGVLWSIVETQASGRTTIVVVELRRPEVDTQTVRIGVPVRYQRNRWAIQDEVSITQTLGTVPLEP